MTTRIQVELADGHYRTRLTSGLLRAQLVHGPADRCRIGLLAGTALLLGGDQVDLEVEVGPGATVELFDVAGTVAYHGRGAASGWRSRLRLHEGARLRWSGEPFVVSDGADVHRVLEVALAEGAAALLRETVVLGRSGEVGGVLRNQTLVNYAGEEILVEDQHLDAAGYRTWPGLLGRHQVMDSIVALGLPGPVKVGQACRYGLVGGQGTVTRYLGSELAASPLHATWRTLTLPRPPASAPVTPPASTQVSPPASRR